MGATTKTAAGAAQEWVARHRGMLAGLFAGVFVIVGLVLVMVVPTTTAAMPEPPLSGTLTQFQHDSEPGSLPEFVMFGADGAPLSNDLLDDRVIVLNFWATWCGPCLHEMPSLNALQGHYDPDEVRVVTLSVDRAGARVVKKFYEEQALDNLGIYLDPKSEAMRALGVRRLPTTFIMHGAEKRLGILEGVAEWDSAEAKALIDHYRAHLEN